MSKIKMFSVHDSKACAYMPPIYFKTKGEAMRAFQTTCTSDKEHQFAKYPHDFTLVELGEFDEPSGKLSALEVPIILANASEFAISSPLQS